MPKFIGTATLAILRCWVHVFVVTLAVVGLANPAAVLGQEDSSNDRGRYDRERYSRDRDDESERRSDDQTAPVVMPSSVPPAMPGAVQPATSVLGAVVAGTVPAEALQSPATINENTIINLGSDTERVTFTFQEAPWPEVLREFATWAGLTLDLTDTPPGYFSYFDSRAHSPAEAVDILNGYLLPRGYVVLRRDQFLVSLRTTNEMLENLIPTVELADLDARGDNELVRIVVPVDDVSPTMAAEEVRGLLGPFGKSTPLAASQSVVLQGFGGTLRQAVEVLSKSKAPVTDDKLDFRSFTLKHIPASEAESQIRLLFGLSAPNATVNVSGARSELDRAAYYRSREQSDRDGRNRDAVPPPIPMLKKVAMNMQVSSLDRNNTLLVTATPEGLLLVENILLSIDVPQSQSALNLASDRGPFLRVYRVSTADEGEVAKTLEVLLPGVVVNEDRRQDTIHIYATTEQHDEVDRLIRLLDGAEAGNRVVEVIPLRVVNPMTAATLLSKMFENEDRDLRPMIQSELPSRTIVVRGTAEQVAQVRAALTGLGEPSSLGNASTAGRVKRISVGGRNAEVIANATEKILKSTNKGSSSVRVVIPGQVNSKAADPDETTTVESAERIDLGSRTHIRTLQSRSMIQPVALTAIGNEQKSAGAIKAKEGTAPPEAKPSVSIEVQGNDLMVYSGDPEALGEVEEIIRELVRQMPEQKRWTVFYLRVAEAEAAAQKLMELTADLQDSMLASGQFDLPPLRIIPDKRTNAIFVSGPDEQMEQIENFLNYIDASDVPGSFLRREPHAIKVQYADVNEIAELLRTLYKDYLIDPVMERLRLERSSRSRDRDESSSSSRSSSASSSSGSSGKTESPGIRLTLAVDNKTGELLVACNDQLFQEIEAVVKQRDLAVRDSQPTVEFVPITGSTPGNLVDLLNGLSPRVTAETLLSPEALQKAQSSSRSNSSGSSYRDRSLRRQ